MTCQYYKGLAACWSTGGQHARLEDLRKTHPELCSIRVIDCTVYDNPIGKNRRHPLGTLKQVQLQSFPCDGFIMSVVMFRAVSSRTSRSCFRSVSAATFRKPLPRQITPFVQPYIQMASYAHGEVNVGRQQATSHFKNEDLHSSKLFDVSGLKAVVTGGGTGIGLMITQALQTNGATVYITGRRQEALDAVVKEYSTGPGKIIALPGDITKKDECLRLAKELEQAEPNGIHALVNNAGTA